MVNTKCYLVPMDPVESLRKRFYRYAKDEWLPAKHEDIRFACEAVLKTASAAANGQCNFSTAQCVVRLFDSVAMERTMEATVLADWEESDRCIEATIPWRDVLYKSSKCQLGHLDDPQELRVSLQHEVDFYNYKHQESLDFKDLSCD